MKKLLLIVLLFLFSAILFPQQVSQKLKYEKIFDLAAECKNVLNWKLSGLISADRADKKLAENEATMSQLLTGEVTVVVTLPEEVTIDSEIFETLDELLLLESKFYAAKKVQTIGYLESIKTKLSGEFETIDSEVFDILSLLIREADSRFYKSVRPSIVEDLEFILELLSF